MTASALSPQEPTKRSKRMLAFYVSTGVVCLLLLIAGANWRVIHLAHCRHLLKSEDWDTRDRAMRRLLHTHLRKGMNLEEVRGLLRPAELVYYGMTLTRGGPSDNLYQIELCIGNEREYGPILTFSGSGGELKDIPSLGPTHILIDS